MNEMPMRFAPQEWVDAIQRIAPVDFVILANGLSNDGMAFWFDGMRIILVREHLSPKRCAETVIHEAMHHALEDLPELAKNLASGKSQVIKRLRDPLRLREEVIVRKTAEIWSRVQEVYDWTGRVERQLWKWEPPATDVLVTDYLACLPEMAPEARR